MKKPLTEKQNRTLALGYKDPNVLKDLEKETGIPSQELKSMMGKTISDSLQRIRTFRNQIDFS